MERSSVEATRRYSAILSAVALPIREVAGHDDERRPQSIRGVDRAREVGRLLQESPVRREHPELRVGHLDEEKDDGRGAMGDGWQAVRNAASSVERSANARPNGQALMY
jgi:hypothetical protein